MRDWLVAGALVEDGTGLLLVQNRRRDGSLDWTPPGGVIDPGETVEDGLTREVLEETGLRVTDWEGPVYDVEAVAAELGWHLRVQVHRARAYEGELQPGDPDGIVVDARFVPVTGCDAVLAAAHHWVREPLTTWLTDRETWEPAGRSFRYEVTGADRSSIVVRRLA
jgi:8-oxo-dGTP pyrophosphatase MutT (NUDIX family)